MIFIFIAYNCIFVFTMSYNPAFQFPADFDKAQKHRLANRIFKGPIPKDQDDRDNMERCQCCNRRIGIKQHREAICYSPRKDLGFLGPGVTLFFVFIQNVIISLVAFALIFSIYSLVSNVQGDSCNSVSNCFDDIFSKLSLSNKISNKDSIVLQTFLISAFLIAYILLKQVLIYRTRAQEHKLDKILVSPSDYSIIIKRLPENTTNADIQAMIEDKKQTMTKQDLQAANHLRIAKIILSYDTQEYIQQMEQQEKNFIKMKMKDSRLPYTISNTAKPTKTGKFAIVTFQQQASKQVFAKGGFVESDFKIIFMNCQFTGQYKVKGKSVIVQRAPEPDDIIWQNAGISIGRRYRNIILSYFFGAIILGLGGLLQYYLQRQQLIMKKEGIQNVYTYLSSLVLIVENAVIEKFLQFITEKQGNETQTLLNQSLMTKTCYYQFLNTGILFLIAHYFADETGNFDIQAGGFAFQLTVFMVANAISSTLLNFVVTRLELPNSIKRYYIKNGYLKHTQKQANQAYQKRPFQYAIKYAFVVKTFWITLFYAPFVPGIVVISMVGIIVFYFTEKELIRTSYKIPNMVSIRITQAARRLLDFGGIILLAGQLLIILYIKYFYKGQDWSGVEIASLSVALGLNVFLLTFPSIRINKYLFPLEITLRQQYYQQVKDDFEITYELANRYSPSDDNKNAHSIKRDIQEYRFISRQNQKVENKQQIKQKLIK